MDEIVRTKKRMTNVSGLLDEDGGKSVFIIKIEWNYIE